MQPQPDESMFMTRSHWNRRNSINLTPCVNLFYMEASRNCNRNLDAHENLSERMKPQDKPSALLPREGTRRALFVLSVEYFTNLACSIQRLRLHCNWFLLDASVRKDEDGKIRKILRLSNFHMFICVFSFLCFRRQAYSITPCKD